MRLGPEVDAWELEDAQERQRNAPDLYSAPTLEEVGRIRAGDRVALLFLFRGRDEHGWFIQNERLWVTVRDAASSAFRGILESPPASSTLLRAGDFVPFATRHVETIQLADGPRS